MYKSDILEELLISTVEEGFLTMALAQAVCDISDISEQMCELQALAMAWLGMRWGGRRAGPAPNCHGEELK